MIKSVFFAVPSFWPELTSNESQILNKQTSEHILIKMHLAQDNWKQETVFSGVIGVSEQWVS